jgi:hypothetical protein
MKTPGSKSVVEDANKPGLAARYPKTSLLEWIGLIELAHRDAVISLQTEDGRKGRIWCVAGDIVDAQCGNLAGLEAVDEILSLPDGDFSVSFDQADRPRRGGSATGAFLFDGALAADQHRNTPYSDAPVARSNRPEKPGGARAQYVAIAASTAAVALGVGLYVTAPPSSGPAAATHIEQVMSNPPEVTVERIVDSRAVESAPINLEEQQRLADLDGAAKQPTVSHEVRRSRPHIETGNAKRAPLTAPPLRRVPADSDPPSPLATWYDVEAQKPRIPITDHQPEPQSQDIDDAKPKVQITEPAKPKNRIFEAP